MPTKPAASLTEAAQDLRLLLGRGYPRERVLALVGDRHGLDARARHLLRRGVFAPAEAAARRGRLLSLADLAGRPVAVDGYNVLITLETALSGGQLILADDGVVRDIAGRGAGHRPTELTLRAAGLMLEALRPASRVLVLLDAPISQSGELAGRLRDMLEERGQAGEARAVPVPERQLKAHQGPVASSDSALIDQVAEPLDLAGAIIQTLEPPPALLRLK